MEQIHNQIASQEALCKSLEEQLSQAKALAVQKHFEVTKLNHAGFFRRHFGNLRKKQDAAWAEYRQAVSAADELKITLDTQKQKLAELRANISQNE